MVEKKIKEGELGIFSIDGKFSIKVVNGEAILNTGEGCFIHHNDQRNYKHDCELCKYLGDLDLRNDFGEIITYDLYYCKIVGEKILLARYGNMWSDCIIGIDLDHPAINVARELAKECGYIV